MQDYSSLSHIENILTILWTHKRRIESSALIKILLEILYLYSYVKCRNLVRQEGFSLYLLRFAKQLATSTSTKNTQSSVDFCYPALNNCYRTIFKYGTDTNFTKITTSFLTIFFVKYSLFSAKCGTGTVTDIAYLLLTVFFVKDRYRRLVPVPY